MNLVGKDQEKTKVRLQMRKLLPSLCSCRIAKQQFPTTSEENSYKAEWRGEAKSPVFALNGWSHAAFMFLFQSWENKKRMRATTCVFAEPRDVTGLSNINKRCWSSQLIQEATKWRGPMTYRISKPSCPRLLSLTCSTWVVLQTYVQQVMEGRAAVRQAVSVITFALCLASAVLLLVALGIFAFFKWVFPTNRTNRTDTDLRQQQFVSKSTSFLLG